jgi:hypothetical protein
MATSGVRSGLIACAALVFTTAIAVANGCSSSNACRVNCGATDTGASTTASTGTGVGTASSSSSSATSTSSGATSTSSATSSSSSGAAGACSLPTPGLALYVGLLAPACPTAPLIGGNSFFSYNDGTAGDGGTVSLTYMTPGCSGTGQCGVYASGSGYTGYGAGIGFTLNNNNPSDAGVGFTGFLVYLMGTTTGTRGSGFQMANHTIHVKFPTSTNRDGDDYGAYCPTQGDSGTGWTLCKLPFAGLTRDCYAPADAGFPACASDMFDLSNLEKIQFEASLYSAEDGGVPSPVSFSIALDDIAFY